ncbi:MAG: cupredoxin domain-containing protein [Nanoarchaeota archaeon]
MSEDNLNESKSGVNELSSNGSEINNSVIKISYRNLYTIGFFIIFAVLVIMFFKGSGSATAIQGTGNEVKVNYATSQVSGDVQIAKMKVVGGEYVIEPNSFKVGIPVKIEAEISQMPGCSKGIVIPAFNIKKSLTENSNIIEFTPNKAGTFNIACSMNMYKGTFTVLQSDGTKSNYIEKASTSGATCGSSGGGCGCGG